MDNPESISITPEVMFQYDNHQNIPWGNIEYNPVKKYLDPMKQIDERNIAERKGVQKDTKYQTRRGFYMDYHIKTMRGVPAPSAYQNSDFWDQSENKKKGEIKKINEKLTKNSYIDQIEKEHKNHKSPGIGIYNLNKTQEQIKSELSKSKSKKASKGPKRYFYEDVEFLANQFPGPGSSNPRYSVDKMRMNKTEPKFWIDKHKKENESHLKKRSSTPGPTSYSPGPSNYINFDKISKKEEMNKSATKTGFGTDTKFMYDRPKKKKDIEVRPAPCSYKMEIEWKGKGSSMEKSWIGCRSTRSGKSIYN